MTKLQTTGYIHKEQLPERGYAEYFQGLTSAAFEAGIFTEADLAQIQSNLLSLISERAEAYTNRESSSIPVKAAQELLHSCIYTIGAALRHYDNPEEAALLLRDTPLLTLHGEGSKRIESLFFQCRQLSTQARQTRLKIPNSAYHATLDGFPRFFAAYVPAYGAHETPADIDYPLACGPGNQTGVEYMQDYLRKLVMENHFCQRFSPLAMHQLLLGYDIYYASLLINLFERVYLNALGCILGGQSPYSLLLTPKAFELLAKRLQSTANLPAMLNEAAEKLFARIELPGQAIRTYASGLHADLTATIQNALTHHCLGAVFIQHGTHVQIPI